MKLDDLTGRRFGRFTVVGRAPNSEKSHTTRWYCRCDCGNVKTVTRTALIKGHIVSCGCYAKERMSKMSFRHGWSRTRLYNLWDKMKSRCLDESQKDYPRYGGRGIKVCPEWRDFVTFRDWALANGYRDDLTLDRRDNDGDYCPENCRWATQKEQGNNRGNNVRITVNGETLTMTEWADKTGLTKDAIWHRLSAGWTPEEAVTVPKRKSRHKLHQNREDGN